MLLKTSIILILLLIKISSASDGFGAISDIFASLIKKDDPLAKLDVEGIINMAYDRIVILVDEVLRKSQTNQSVLLKRELRILTIVGLIASIGALVSSIFSGIVCVILVMNNLKARNMHKVYSKSMGKETT